MDFGAILAKVLLILSSIRETMLKLFEQGWNVLQDIAFIMRFMLGRVDHLTLSLPPGH